MDYFGDEESLCIVMGCLQTAKDEKEKKTVN